jgi:hypothetical protein
MISGVSKVIIEVDDQERAKTFWTETMGFDLAQDSPSGGERWLEVRSPDGSLNIRAGPSTSRQGHQAFGCWSMFNDSDGNRFALEQTGPEAS